MAWTTPGTATAGEVLTAAFWNTQVRDNMKMISTWTSYTPSWTGLTIGNGTNTGAYIQAGKTVAYYIKLIFGSTSSLSSTPVVTLPINGKSSQIGIHAGLFEDVGVNFYMVTARMNGSSIECYASTASGSYVGASSINATTPFTWGTGDIIQVSGVYETG